MTLTKHEMHIMLTFKMELHIMLCFKGNRLQMTSTKHELLRDLKKKNVKKCKISPRD